MKTIFDTEDRDELISRINTLNENSKAQWGKMNIYQMLRHCTLWEEWVLSKKKNKITILGCLFGKMALKNVLKDEKPFMRNSPTLPELRVRDSNVDIALEKEKWIRLLKEHANSSNEDFVHNFFGKMTNEQNGYLAYKHIDHHLRQFNS